MSASATTHSPNTATIPEKGHLHQVGPGFWNARAHFKIMAKLVDLETHMSIVQLQNGKFIVIDTVELSDQLRHEIDQLTNGGEKIEAVLATHPFHTLAFPGFYHYYPKPAYYGTPRHLRRLTEIPWAGSLEDCHIRQKWQPELDMRIPAGAEFVAPQPESSNHFACVFVYHPASRTLHVDDTIMFADKPGFLLRLFGFKPGTMQFQPVIKSSGLHPTAEAPLAFRDWMRQMLNDWPFDNICCAHLGAKIGGAHADVTQLLNDAEPLLTKLSENNRKRNPNSALPPDNHPNMNIKGDECG